METYLADNARGDCHVDAARMGAPKREREEQAKVAAVAAMVAKRVKGSGAAFDKVNLHLHLLHHLLLNLLNHLLLLLLLLLLR